MEGDVERAPQRTPTPPIERRHEVVDHTADARLRVWAETLPALFEETCAALSTLTVEIDPGVPHPAWVETEVDGHDLEHLAFAWLNELIALAEMRHRAIACAEVIELTEAGPEAGDRSWRLRGRVGLQAFDPAAVRALRQVKAATLHELEIGGGRDGWHLAAVVDI
jgi:SHS2 domain-containing protein